MRDFESQRHFDAHIIGLIAAARPVRTAHRQPVALLQKKSGFGGFCFLQQRAIVLRDAGLASLGC